MRLIERRLFLRITLIALAYFAAAIFGLLWAVGISNATPLWAPAGIAVGSVIVFGARVWPGIFIGALAANFIHLWHQDLSTLASVTGALAIAAGNTLEALIVERLCLKRLEGRNPLDEPFDLVKFVPIAMGATLASAAVGTFTMFLLGLNAHTNSPLIFVTWWLGDTLGILVFAPFLISWFKPNLRTNTNWFELLAAFGVLFIVLETSFWNHFPVSSIISRPWWLAPVLLWFVFRFSQREVATAVTVVCLSAIFATANNRGPFVSPTLNEAFLSEQLFCAMVALTMLLLSASLTKMAKYQLQLKQSNNQLELRVSERTRELEKKTRILEAINNQLRIEAQERLAAEKRLHDLQSKPL